MSIIAVAVEKLAVAVAVSLRRASALSGFDMFWSRDEFVLCKGLATLVYWRRIEGRWVDCRGV